MGIRTGQMAEIVGGPKDGQRGEKEICVDCGAGEVMDLLSILPSDPVGIIHMYRFDEESDTFRYVGQIDTLGELR